MSSIDTVHQFHSGTAAGDAITNQMLEWQRHLRRLGWHSEIFAEHVAPELADQIRPLRSYGGSAGELLLVHHSHGYAAFDEVIDLPNPMVAMYHNITPEHFFEHPLERRYCRLGRDQLAYLARRALFGIAPSNYNRLEMLEAGFRRVDVIPVRVDFREFADAGRIAGLRGTDWLFVGRVVSSKCQHLLVEAFAAYSRTFDPRARLVLVGSTADEEYRRRVVATATRFGIEDRVQLRGKVSDRELREAFASASVYVSLSEHEGFGVPLLEAMAAGLPVVAYASSAVPETMGGAGILLRTQDPATVAATVRAVHLDGELRNRLCDRQESRVAQVGRFDLTAALRRTVDRAAGLVPPLTVQIQGPFETSYSLASTNRRLALELAKAPELAVSIHATEGPGDYVPDPRDLARHPEAAALYRKSPATPFPDVVIRQMWPPRVLDSPGAVTLEYFAWEESRVPRWMVDEFNSRLDGIGVTSTFVADALRRSGVTVPVQVVGNGVDVPDPDATIDAPELADRAGFTILHISSAFPRKGVDVLLEAYFDAFSGSDDVTLVLKTFPNPHNQVAELLAGLRSAHADPPRVCWIDRDLADGELAALYGLADAYVHPARAEGFGLPVAEAMAAGVPVISVTYSGLGDFVSEQTAVTVPFTVAPSESHLTVPGSEWAEPDAAALADAMVALVERRDPDGVAARVCAAQELILDRYSWAAAADRWRDLITRIDSSTGPRRVAMVTSWNSRCGIAENSRYIVEEAGDDLEFAIFADRDAELIDPTADIGVVRVWKDRWTPDLDDLDDALLTTDADVVHFQFNFGFFEFDHLAELIERQLPRRGVVLTMHRTLDYDDRGELLSLVSIAGTLRRADHLIVHQAADARYLADMGIEDNVSLVPIGVAPAPPVTYDEVRSTLAVGDRPIVGTFGFLLPHKGTLELVDAVDALRSEFPDILLLAQCAGYPNQESREYEATIRARIRDRGLEENVLLLTDYLPDDTARSLLRASDVIVLPYQETGESSSASLRFVLPLGRAVVVTDQPIFDDARGVVEVAGAVDAAGIGEAVGKVLRDAGLRSDLAGRADRWSEEYLWDRVLSRHKEIYAAAARAGAARREQSWALPVA